MVPIIKLENVHFSYKINEKKSIEVLNDVSFTIQAGEYVAIIGHNGSGKSTISKHLNGILTPSIGDVWVNNLNTKETSEIRNIRQAVGMVFQHPDNQIVATIVEEDVAFGLENLNIPRDEMKQRVKSALETVRMYEFRNRPPHHLSGGQKQRVAIAGVLAMNPQCIVFDEATSMLDSYGRQDVLQVMKRMHEKGMTIITVTHHMTEAAQADRILVVEHGEIVMDGTPREVFRHKARLQGLQLDVPAVNHIAAKVHKSKPAFSEDIINEEELLEEIESWRQKSKKEVFG